MRKSWTKTEVTSLPTNLLLVIKASTNPEGDLSIELRWACDEIERRRRLHPADVAREEDDFVRELISA